MKFGWSWLGLLGAALLCTTALTYPNLVRAEAPQYADGQSQQQMDRAPSDDPQGWDQIFQGLGPGYREGFHAGYEDARSDSAAGRAWHFGERFTNPESGYRLEFGSRDDFMRDFRQGYEEGYRHAYSLEVD
jgi:flagellar biosynthesis/type III secretory pathway protein FliH